MASKMNTAKTIERTSTALENKVENTRKNMKTLMRRAGCAGDPMIDVEIPANGKDDVLFVGLNTVDFYFMRGAIAEMPLSVAEIAANTRQLGALGKQAVIRKRAEMAKKAAAQTESKEA